jgi:hypothetical protein
MDTSLIVAILLNLVIFGIEVYTFIFTFHYKVEPSWIFTNVSIFFICLFLEPNIFDFNTYLLNGTEFLKSYNLSIVNATDRSPLSIPLFWLYITSFIKFWILLIIYMLQQRFTRTSPSPSTPPPLTTITTTTFSS